MLEPRPWPPRWALCSGLKRKWTSVLWESEDDDQHIAAVATVAARRPAPGNELFPAKGHAAIAAVSGLDAYFGLIDEHIQSPTYASQFSTSQFSGSRVGYIS